MNRFIPDFILEKVKLGKLTGKFNSSVLIIDIVGFTALTEKLITKGKEGAEILSEIINKIYDPVIRKIYELGGWVSSFAGDSFISIFPENQKVFAVLAAVWIRNYFKEKKIKVRKEDYKLNIRIGLSSGKLEWNIIDNPLQSVYFIKGSGIISAVSAIKNSSPGEICTEKKFIKGIEKELKIKKKSGNYLLISDVKKIYTNEKINVKQTFNETTKKFIPSTVLQYKGKGEFRNIVSIFIKIKETSSLNIEIINSIIEYAHKYNGYFNKIDFSDKGLVALVLFGAPQAVEKIQTRAIDFLIELNSRLKEKCSVKSGLSEGIAFTGVLGSNLRSEYTALGKTVNLTSRIMEATPWQKINMDQTTANLVKKEYLLSSQGSIKAKGFTQKIKIYSIEKSKNDKGDFSGKFFGRTEYLKKLQQIIEPINNGKFAGIVYLDGPPGIGKSRLIYELKKNLELDKINWFLFQSNEHLKESFNPVIYFLNNYFNQREENLAEENKKQFEKTLKKLIKMIQDEKLREDLIRGKYFLGALINIFWQNSIYEQLSPQLRFENTINALVAFIKCESLYKPVVIEIEDGHWLDEMTEIFINKLCKKSVDTPILIISECRLKDDGTLFTFNFGNIPVNRINLGILSEEESHDMISSILQKDITKELFRVIFEKSEGNPFYIEQIVLYLIEMNLICEKEDGYNFIDKTFELPVKINNIIIARIDRLSEELKTLIKTASVLGREFSINILSEMLRGKAIISKVKKVEAEDIWHAISEIKYIFKHALIREAVYEMQLKKQLRKLHKLAGETIEKFFKKELNLYYGELGYHFKNAEIKKKAKRYIRLAADQAKENYRNIEALKFYNLLEQYLNKKEKVLINIIKADIHYFLGDWKQHEELLNENLKKSEELKLTSQVMEIKNKLGAYYGSIGETNKAKVLLEKLRKELERSTNLNLKASVNDHLGNIYCSLGDLKQSLPIYKESLALYLKLKNYKNISGIYCNIGDVYRFIGNYKLAKRYFILGLKIARKEKEKFIESLILGNLAILYFNSSDYNTSKKVFYQQLNIAIEIGDKFGEALAYGNLSSLYFSLHDMKRTIEFLLKKKEIVEDLGNKRSLNIVLGNLGWYYLKQRKFDKAEECFRNKLKDAKEMNDKYNIGVANGNLGELYLKQKEIKKSEKYLKKSISILREINVRDFMATFLNTYAQLKYSQKEFKTAYKLTEESLKIAKELNMTDLITDNQRLQKRLI